MQPGQVKTRLETLAKLLVKDTEDSPEALQLACAAIKAVESTSGDPMFQQVLWGMTETGAGSAAAANFVAVLRSVPAEELACGVEDMEVMASRFFATQLFPHLDAVAKWTTKPELLAGVSQSDVLLLLKARSHFQATEGAGAAAAPCSTWALWRKLEALEALCGAVFELCAARAVFVEMAKTKPWQSWGPQFASVDSCDSLVPILFKVFTDAVLQDGAEDPGHGIFAFLKELQGATRALKWLSRLEGACGRCPVEWVVKSAAPAVVNDTDGKKFQDEVHAAVTAVGKATAEDGAWMLTASDNVLRAFRELIGFDPSSIKSSYLREGDLKELQASGGD